MIVVKKMNDKYQYYNEFIETKNKQKFVKLLVKKHGLKEQSALRRWYDVYKLKPKKEYKTSLHIIKKNKVYLNEWLQTGTKEGFIKLLLKKQPHLNPKTAERRYYDVKTIPLKEEKEIKKKPKIQTEPEKKVELKHKKYDDEYKTPVNDFKILMLNDMNRFNIRITRKYLNKYGFSDYEINWLEENGHVFIQEETQW